MNDPGAPKGSYTDRGIGGPYRHLVPGRRYRVVKAFKDFDREDHPVGEEWVYLGTAFLPYDDGRSIFVSFDGVREWMIRMQDRIEEQRPILDEFGSYVVEVG